ncbi:MAG: recombination mediator RecR [Synergistota bacterium]|nr:recombination mediator RecR [Synergistota bacterium]OPZ41099.1 MAG: Recombination protein RecR [Synergistetes bacterium ADurb.BinA166]
MPLPDPFERLSSLLRKMPGVGAKSARRMAFYVLQQPPSYAEELSRVLTALKERVGSCSICGNITDQDPCSICSDPLRDRGLLCVVETVEDLFSIEHAGVFSGLYQVLGGRVSPLDGETLDDHVLESLLERVRGGGIREVIIATNPRIEGDLTYHALVKFLGPSGVPVSRIAYGLPVGGSIEFADRTTLQAAMESRVRVKGVED